MAMTKKERAEFDKALDDARLLGALRWTSPVSPDVPPPEYGAPNRLSTGWALCGPMVEVACSSSVFHGIGRTDKTTSQQPRWLYSSKLLALKALRHELERRSAMELAAIDKQIAQAEAT
jgi:hypothetical protein